MVSLPWSFGLLGLILVTTSVFEAIEPIEGNTARNSWSRDTTRPPCNVHGGVTRCYDVDITDLESYFRLLTEESHTLEITHSNLTRLTGEPFRDKTNWEVVYVAKNDIAEIEYDAFRKLNKVVAINLERNLLRTLDPKTFAYCYLLVKLILRYNPLILGEEPFLESNHLEYLDLSFANLTDLPLETFKSLLRLRYLNISYNLLEVLDSEVFAPLLQLEVLDVTNNNFKAIDHRIFSMYSLIQLNNQWNCDCDLKIVFYKIFENVTLAPDAVRCSESAYWTEMKSLDCTNHVANKTLYGDLDEYRAAMGVDKRISKPEANAIPPDILLVVLSSVIVVLVLVLGTVLICWFRTRNKVKINHPEEHSLDTSWQYGTVMTHRAGGAGGHRSGYDGGTIKGAGGGGGGGGGSCAGGTGGTLAVSAPILRNTTLEGIPMSSIRPTAPRMSDVYHRIDPSEHDASYSDQEADDVALYERMH